jgi:hypothetical protein
MGPVEASTYRIGWPSQAVLQRRSRRQSDHSAAVHLANRMATYALAPNLNHCRLACDKFNF